MSGCHDSEDKNLSPLVEQLQKLDHAINQVKDDLSKEIGLIEARINAAKDCHLAFDIHKLSERIDELENRLRKLETYA